MPNLIKCIHCDREFEMSEALTHQLKEELSSSLEADFKQKIEAAQKEAEEKATKRIAEEVELKLKDKENEANQAKEQNKKLQQDLLEAMRKERELKERDEQRELELEKKLTIEREKLKEEMSKRYTDEYRLKELENEKRINDLKKALDEAQRKAQQGSMQTQGEVLELDLEQALMMAFPTDDIEPVEKGVKGADIRHTVKTSHGNVCGVILWETKRTKAWSDEWITKLNDDLRASKANIPVIVSSVLPKEAESGMGIKDGVWIVNFNLFISLARILRDKLTDVAKEKFYAQNKDGKADQLYGYITSHEFKQQVEAILEVYSTMKEQVDRERRAYEKLWAAREVQAERMFRSTARIVGSIQGTVGSSMTQIKGLDLLELENGE
ncbi:MAG TPA: DUF2130 domain-containing protein [Candidatus Levybacteria bacterium]|nr:DUF2130 domain-containing protein [Candidatus Levybacteria bacterium]